MTSNLHPLAGVYAAAITPLKQDGSLDFESGPALLRFYATRGCTGVLFFGTTGEGPSFSPKERESFLRSIRAFRHQAPNFKLLAGTGTPSLNETIELTKLSFDLGFDGALVLPPYYFRKADDNGLFNWFSEVIQQAVPENKHLLGYHIPGTSGVGFSIQLLSRLKEKFPQQFAGIKDSSGDENFSAEVGKHFGSDLLVLNGTDSHFHHALKHHAQGAITACANLISPDLREIWDLFNEGKDPSEVQARVKTQREILEKYAPFPAVVKALMHDMYGFNEWTVKPPLMDLTSEAITKVSSEFSAFAK